MPFFFFSSRRRHTRFDCDWSSDVCSSDLSTPFRRGMPRSSTAMSGQCSRASRTASRPSAASATTLYPSSVRSCFTPCLTIRWSSAKRILSGISVPHRVRVPCISWDDQSGCCHHREGAKRANLNARGLDREQVGYDGVVVESHHGLDELVRGGRLQHRRENRVDLPCRDYRRGVDIGQREQTTQLGYCESRQRKHCRRRDGDRANQNALGACPSSHRLLVDAT